MSWISRLTGRDGARAVVAATGRAAASKASQPTPAPGLVRAPGGRMFERDAEGQIGSTPVPVPSPDYEAEQ